MESLIITIIDNERKRVMKESKQREWGLTQMHRLLKLVNDEMSSAMWDLLLFKINTLYVKNGKVCYSSFDKPSKKVIAFLEKHNDTIIKNWDELMK